jgi:hypothetical protein
MSESRLTLWNQLIGRKITNELDNEKTRGPFLKGALIDLQVAF